MSVIGATFGGATLTELWDLTAADLLEWLEQAEWVNKSREETGP
jgi:hypothetical protein